MPKTDDDEAHLASANAIIDSALDKYGPSRTAISFNGGKDATVVLYLCLDRLRARGLPPSAVRVIYFPRGDEFPEVSEFIARVATDTGFAVEDAGASFAEGMKSLVGGRRFPAFRPGAVGTGGNDVMGSPGSGRSQMEGSGDAEPVECFVLGTRSCDPNGRAVRAFEMTDPGWPQVMRAHPILDWPYAAVWRYLHGGPGREYCPLYDEGYTSIGGTGDTLRNESLAIGGGGEGGYLPARRLEDETLERNGRVRREKPPP